MGESFTIDAVEVHTIIVKIIAHNEEAESVIKLHEDKRYGRKDWKALKSHYEGIGVYSNDITKADLYLRTIIYTGEKKLKRWWIEFERRLCLAYQTYVKHEGREVHSDQMKLRTLLLKVTCDWLSQIKRSIKLRLSDRPMTYTFTQALNAFKTEVNIKYPPRAIQTTKVQELTKGRGQRGRDYGRYTERERFGRGR